MSCVVNNTENFDGLEVIQVYIGKTKSEVKPAPKGLKGFNKVKLNPGVKSNINIKIPVNALALYDETISDWNIEKGDYTIYVGSASNTIFKELKISIL